MGGRDSHNLSEATAKNHGLGRRKRRTLPVIELSLPRSTDRDSHLAPEGDCPERNLSPVRILQSGGSFLGVWVVLRLMKSHMNDYD